MTAASNNRFRTRFARPRIGIVVVERVEKQRQRCSRLNAGFLNSSMSRPISSLSSLHLSHCALTYFSFCTSTPVH